MSTVSVPALNTTMEKTHVWLCELADQGPFDDVCQAYSALSAVLHALRDRLPMEEATHLAAQLPMLVRGLYYEGWSPARNPTRERSARDFADTVGANLCDNPRIDALEATRAVFALLSEKISAGEIDDIRMILPDDIRALWPEEES